MFSEAIRIDLPIDLDRARKQGKTTGAVRAKRPPAEAKPASTKKSQSQRAKEPPLPPPERKTAPLANVLFPDGL